MSYKKGFLEGMQFGFEEGLNMFEYYIKNGVFDRESMQLLIDGKRIESRDYNKEQMKKLEDGRE